jgi:hypothetical protein
LAAQNQNTQAAAHRQKDFSAHWQAADSSTATDTPQKQNLSASNKRVLGNLDASWDMYDETEQPDEAQSKKENVQKPRSKGDGMGGRNGSQRTWGFGEDSEPEVEPQPIKKKQQPKSEEKSWWDF